MRLFELFLDDGVGPFCIVEYVMESSDALEFALRLPIMFLLALPMFVFIAPAWLVWQAIKD